MKWIYYHLFVTLYFGWTFINHFLCNFELKNITAKQKGNITYHLLFLILCTFIVNYCKQKYISPFTKCLYFINTSLFYEYIAQMLQLNTQPLMLFSIDVIQAFFKKYLQQSKNFDISVQDCSKKIKLHFH